MSMIASFTLALVLQPSAAPLDADASARVDAPTPAGITARYDFDNDNVDGERLSPDGVDVPASHKARFPSMITIRGTFIDHMIHMAADV